MARNIVGVIIGIFVAGIIIWSIQSINLRLYPIPVGLDTTDMEAMEEFSKSLPAGAFITVLLSHLLGALGGAWVGCIVADRYFLKISMIIAAFLLVMGIINLLMLPHPVWFMVADIPSYTIGAWIGYKLYKSTSKS